MLRDQSIGSGFIRHIYNGLEVYQRCLIIFPHNGDFGMVLQAQNKSLIGSLVRLNHFYS